MAAFEPIEHLANRMSDADLKPIVDVGNHYIINNRKLLYQLEQTFQTLSNLKILDSTFSNFGKLLENERVLFRAGSRSSRKATPRSAGPTASRETARFCSRSSSYRPASPTTTRRPPWTWA